MTTRRTLAQMRPRLQRYLTHEHLTLREMAQREGLSMSGIYYWQRRCGLPRAETFWRSFETHYGPRARQRVVAGLDAGWTMAKIARQLGCSREWVRQVRNRLQDEQQTA